MGVPLFFFTITGIFCNKTELFCTVPAILGKKRTSMNKSTNLTKGQKMDMYSKLERLIREVTRIAIELRDSSPKTKALAISGIIVTTFLPLYIGIILWLLMSPVGFWQVFALAVALVILLGTTQLGCLIICVIGIFKLLIGKKTRVKNRLDKVIAQSDECREG